MNVPCPSIMLLAHMPSHSWRLRKRYIRPHGNRNACRILGNDIRRLEFLPFGFRSIVHQHLFPDETKKRNFHDRHALARQYNQDARFMACNYICGCSRAVFVFKGPVDGMQFGSADSRHPRPNRNLSLSDVGMEMGRISYCLPTELHTAVTERKS